MLLSFFSGLSPILAADSKMITYSDIFKDKFLKGFDTDMGAVAILPALLVTVVISAFIFLIYRITTKSALYSKSFGISMSLISVVTSSIIISMQSNIVLSLGMVGALSIVRFRTAIKDPRDLLFLFWSISVGIIVGGGLFEVAIVSSVIITLALIGYDILPSKRAPYLLIINSTAENTELMVLACCKNLAKQIKVKSRTISAGRTDLVIELTTVKGEELIKQVSSLEGIINASLLSHDGDTQF